MTYPSGAGPALEVEAASIKSKGLSLTFSAKVVFAVVKVMEVEVDGGGPCALHLRAGGGQRAAWTALTVIKVMPKLLLLLMLVVGIYWAPVPNSVLRSFTCSTNSLILKITL